MSRQFVPLLALTLVASGAVTAHRAVGHDGAQATVANQKVIGIADTDAADTKQFAVTVKGTAIVETGAAIVKGVALAVDASGRVVTAAALAVADPAMTADGVIDAGATPVTSSAANGDVLTLTVTAAQGAITGGYLPQYILGDALEAASGAGEFIEVLLR